MKIAVLGCGAIGGLFLGYLSKAGHDVTGIVRDYQKKPLLAEGLKIEGACGEQTIEVSVNTRLTEKVDLVIFATKTAELETAAKDNFKFIKEAVAVSTQNGIQADYLLSSFFPKERLISGVVMFGATFYAPNRIVHNFIGDLILGSIEGVKIDKLDQTVAVLKTAFNVFSLDNIKGAKYLKLFINLNNCIPAILGISMQDTFSDIDLARLAIKLNKEAYEIIGKLNIELVSLPTYPKERIEGLVQMPLDQAAALFSKIMTNLSKEPLYGSILQSIQRGKLSEVDYINGEIYHQAIANREKAPLNQKMVELVHRVEERKTFLTKQELLKEIKGATQS